MFDFVFLFSVCVIIPSIGVYPLNKWVSSRGDYFDEKNRAITQYSCQ